MAGTAPLIQFPEQVSGVSPLNGDALDGTVKTRAAPPAGTSAMMDITRLHPHPDNIRESIGDVTEMAASMRSCGVLQPLTVAPHPLKAGNYYVIAGHRRLEASKLAGLREVPVIVRQTGIGTPSAIQLMLIENCQRADLGPMEKAEAMGTLRASGMNGAKIAKAIGLTEMTVSRYLALLELSDATKQKVASGKLPVGDALRAVRDARARRAAATGHADRRDVTGATWEPDHFTNMHPLARKAAALCDARQHNNRRRLGKVACGQCFESVIRDDERLVVAAQSPAEPGIA